MIGVTELNNNESQQFKFCSFAFFKALVQK